MMSARARQGRCGRRGNCRDAFPTASLRAGATSRPWVWCVHPYAPERTRIVHRAGAASRDAAPSRGRLIAGRPAAARQPDRRSRCPTALLAISPQVRPWRRAPRWSRGGPRTSGNGGAQQRVAAAAVGAASPSTGWNAASAGGSAKISQPWPTSTAAKRSTSRTERAVGFGIGRCRGGHGRR